MTRRDDAEDPVSEELEQDRQAGKSASERGNEHASGAGVEICDHRFTLQVADRGVKLLVNVRQSAIPRKHTRHIVETAPTRRFATLTP